MKLELSVDLILKDNIDCDYSIWQVATHDELRLMGGVFRNCLANSSGYEPENIFFLVYNGKPVVCIEIKEDRVYQIRSKFNNEPSTKHRKIVETWLLEMGVEGIKSEYEYRDRTPVGERPIAQELAGDMYDRQNLAQPIGLTEHIEEHRRALADLTPHRTLAGIMNAEQELQHMIDRQRGQGGIEGAVRTEASLQDLQNMYDELRSTGRLEELTRQAEMREMERRLREEELIRLNQGNECAANPRNNNGTP